jgi:predicted metal-dependent phosphotriesterase family hydrolase
VRDLPPLINQVGRNPNPPERLGWERRAPLRDFALAIEPRPRHRYSRAMTRREWITGMARVLIIDPIAVARFAAGQPPEASGLVQTVTGPVPAVRLGVTLMHEHVLVDFIGADQVSPHRYDAKHAFTTVLPHLLQARKNGCNTLVECTPAYLGRDVALLKLLSETSGLHILSNTGYYGAAKDKHLPRHAFTESADQLAARWMREFERGIDGTPIKPAFMKIGVDEAPLSDVDRKLVRAAALTSRNTGLPIASHTGTGLAALSELEVLDGAGVPASRFIWVHAQSERDAAFHTRAAKAGAWVEFDGISESSIARHVELVTQMKAQGLLGRVLVSQDAGWYRVGEPGGGHFRPFDTMFTSFVPALTAAGVTSDEVRQLLVDNPRQALTGGSSRSRLPRLVEPH